MIKGQCDSVLAQANILIEKDSTNWQVHYYLGKSYQLKRKYFDAIYNYENANKLDSANKIVESALAEAYDFVGKDEDAINIHYNQYLRDTLVLEPILKLANIFRKKKEFAPAIHYYQKAVSIDPENFYYHKQLAFCYNKINVPIGAIYSYKTAIMLNPYDLSLYVQLANIMNSERMFSETIKTCNEGLKRHNDNNQLQKIKAYAHYLNHDFDSSIVGFSYLLESEDSSFFNLKYRGLSYFEKKEFVTAIEDLSKAYGLNKNDAELCFYLGSAYGRSNSHWKGIKYLDKSFQILSPSPKELSNIYSEKAYIYQGKEDYNMALEYLKKAYKAEATPLLSFKMAQLYDYFLDNKKLAINYYDGYLAMSNEPDTLVNEPNVVIENKFTRDEKVIKNAKERIRILQEELFFEGDQ